MKKTFFLLLILLNTFQIKAQGDEKTTYYFIRHAEKERTDEANKNPDLTEKGLFRAENWNTVFENVAFDAVYSTNYNRTIQTATPVALSKNLEVQFYDPNELFSEEFKIDTKGKTILIVGHSNTTPQFVNAIIGSDKYPEMEDTNNSNLYIVTIINNIKTDILLVI